MLDLTSGEHPDLVVTHDACDADVGATRWDVYRWSVSGFPSSPVPFAIPASRCKQPFDAVAADRSSLRWATVDLTGDGNLDLVVTEDDCNADVGRKYWDVYPWSSAGFAMVPTQFEIPAGRCNTTFDAFVGTQSVRWATTDITGDRHPDLIVTQDSCDGDVGTSRWDVYAWTSAGFAKTPSTFTVPPPRCQKNFDALAGADPLRWVVQDLTGDGHADLVVTYDDCDKDVGTSRWDVHAWSASGFAVRPSTFSIPAPRCNKAFGAVAESAGSLSWTTMALTGKKQPDLVVTSDACDVTVGASRWDVYRWSSTGFAPTPSSFDIPAPRCNASFSKVASTSQSLAWSTLALVDTCKAALVVTKDTCDATVGTSRWDYYAQP
ncbi:hypothetical protein AKJ09_01838 [Labilithrix luteola]|uniref:VCBS repeat-containing protein n=2 Tax=Labilithrix luteola TaxID=1391654 RepID=A0A0K1PPX9_9BACT|nr:hypothetical protein AKJ09_01838 [Labilithrix luteola]